MYFTASNKFKLRSNTCPAAVTTISCLYLRGSEKDRDDEVVVVRQTELEKIKQAVKEYNEKWAVKKAVVETTSGSFFIE